MCGLSLVAANGGYSSLRCAGPSLRWPLSLLGTGSRRVGFSSCGSWAQSAGSVVVAHGLSCSTTCGIFPDQGSNRVPCIGRWIPNHCATREVHGSFFAKIFWLNHHASCALPVTVMCNKSIKSDLRFLYLSTLAET